MKAITIWQPYAQAIALGLKQYETRSWVTHHRGPIAIHASMRPMSPDARHLAAMYGMGDNLERGAIIAICELVDCIPMTPEFIAAQPKSEIDFGDWRVGRYAWQLRVVRVLDTPKPVCGRQGLWNWDE